MHVGMGTIFQNPHDQRSDAEVYVEELRLTDLAEPLGFESIWGVEHHFTDYTMCPDVLQFLTYMAGRTRRARLGSMVVVLPWHDPLRVAEQVSVLDHVSGGRFILGIGRGLGRVEFDGFRVPMAESRARFIESAQLLLQGLETGYCALDGQYIRQPRKPIRPKPQQTFKGRTYAAAVSPESVRIMAELGVGILIIPQKPWDVVAAELAEYRSVYRTMNGAEPPPTIAAGWTFCDPDAERARALAQRYIGGYWDSVIRHYEFTADHLTRTRGYEYYGKLSEMVGKYGTQGVTDFFLNLQVWGTPEQCYEKILDIRSRVGCGRYVGIFSYAGMPYEEAERNLRLFAREVLPELRKLPEEAGAALASPGPAPSPADPPPSA
jgi:alkanesulfonate monooxygenase SsuD/methylene tetrahydromethanopterin reductase-like flavin-dependent oxidoreductase (luciferase family)